MRIAILSDIHGNSVALDAVLADIEAQGGVDRYWVLGDLVAPGSDPIGVLERIAALPNLSVISGNADRYTVTDDLPPPTLAEVHERPELIPIYTEVAAGFAWTRGALSYTGWVDWIKKLPFDLRLTLPDGTRMYGVHASPRHDMDAIYPYTAEAEKRLVADLAQADLLFSGHIHWQWETRIGNVHWVGLGSVGNPVMAHLQATYAIVEATTTGYRVDLCQVEYDRELAIAQLYEQRHPAADFIAGFMRGKFVRDQSIPQPINELVWKRD